MRIAQLAPPLESVPPSRYGGTERVISTLTEELVRRGHDVTMFASGDSRTSARLVPVVEEALWHHTPRYNNFAPFWALTLGKLALHLEEFDIVHSHLDFFGFPLARFANVPMLHTLHGRLDLAELEPLYQEYTDLRLVSISHAQRRPHPQANWLATVHHGIDVDEFTYNPRPSGYVAFLGRISPEKGLDTAIRVARRAGVPIKIAARLPLPHSFDPNAHRDWEYYEDVIQPLLQGRDVEFVGQLGGREKEEFLREAAALLFPINWPEPFGLVIPEALACGTPVIATRYGSVPELIRDSVTGFICDDEDEMVAAVRRIGTLDRARCRWDAEQRFSAAAMTDRYERIYEALVRQESPGPEKALAAQF